MAKFMDKSGRFFGKVSVIDVLLVVLIIGLAAGFGYKRLSAPAERIVYANTKFYATFEVEKVREFSVAAFAVGDVLYEQYGQQPLGKIVAIRIEEARDVLKRADGTAILAQMEEKYNVYITIEASGSVNERGYYFNGNQQLAVGSDLTLQSNMVLCSARVFWLGIKMGDNATIGAPHELLRTGEFFTAEQMELLKAQALSWQSATAAFGGVDVVAIEPSDGSKQQVYVSANYIFDKAVFENYEKIRIQTIEGVQARIISAESGAGSGEVLIGFRFITEDSEWIEIFYVYAGNLEDSATQWENVTEGSGEIIELLNSLSPDERQFK